MVGSWEGYPTRRRRNGKKEKRKPGRKQMALAWVAAGGPSIIGGFLEAPKEARWAEAPAESLWEKVELTDDHAVKETRNTSHRPRSLNLLLHPFFWNRQSMLATTWCICPFFLITRYVLYSLCPSSYTLSTYILLEY